MISLIFTSRERSIDSRFSFNMDFSGLPHITEKIFKYLDLESALNCRLVCSNWKQVLDNAMMWLANCPKDHPLAAQTIFAKTLIKIFETLEEPKMKSKFGLLLLDCYFAKCKLINRSLKRCQPNHSYLIWPLMIAMRKHKAISMAEKILSFVGNPKCLKIKKECEGGNGIKCLQGIPGCCFLHPKQTFETAFEYGQPDIVELLYNLSNIIAIGVYWNSVLCRAINQGYFRIVKLVMPKCEKSIEKLCYAFSYVRIHKRSGHDIDNYIKICEIFIGELRKLTPLSEVIENQNYKDTVIHFIKSQKRKEFIDLFKDSKELQDHVQLIDNVHQENIHRNQKRPYPFNS